MELGDDVDVWRDTFLSLDRCDDLLATLSNGSSLDRSWLEAGGQSIINGTSTQNVGLHPVDPTAKPVRTKKKRPTETTKQRIAQLRETIHEAESTLAVLRSRHDQSTGSERGSNQTATDALTARVWKDAALRQYRRRRKSEVLNAHLRAVCREQEKVMQRLERLVLRSRAMLQSCTPMTVVPVDIEAVRCARRISELMAITSDLYMQVQLGMLPDAWQLENMGATANDPYNTTHRLVPCRPQAVSTAVWSYFCRPSGETESYYRERVETSQDTIVKSFHIRWANASVEANHRGLVVARRYVLHDDLALIVYTAELESLESNGNLRTRSVPPGFRTNAWTTVRQSPDASGYSEVVIRHVTNPIETPIAETAIPTTQCGIQQFTRLAQFSLRRHLERVQRAIDSAFL